MGVAVARDITTRVAAKRPAQSGAGFVTHFTDTVGTVDVDRVAEAFRMTKGQLAEAIGLGTATISKADRKTAPRTQTRVLEMREIVALPRGAGRRFR